MSHQLSGRTFAKIMRRKAKDLQSSRDGYEVLRKKNT